MIRGVDVGSPQGFLSLGDWHRFLADGVGFGVLRCGQGASAAPDPRFASNLAAARLVGLPVGPYFVGIFGPGVDAARQADAHWPLARGLGASVGDLPPALDMELPEVQDWAARGVTAQMLVDGCAAYLARMTELSGRRPLFYTYRFFEAALAHGADVTPIVDAADLWLASYPQTPIPWPASSSSMPALDPWGAASVWQYSGGRPPGGVYRTALGVPVDTDCVRDEAALALLVSVRRSFAPPPAGTTAGLVIPGANAPTEPDPGDPRR